MQLNQSYSKVVSSIKSTGSKQFPDGVINYWYLVHFQDGAVAAFGKQQFLDETLIGKVLNFSVVGMDQLKNIPRINVNSISLPIQSGMYGFNGQNEFNNIPQQPRNSSVQGLGGVQTSIPNMPEPIQETLKKPTKSYHPSSDSSISNRVYGGYAKDLVAAGKTSAKDISDFFKIWELCIAKGKELDENFPIGALDNFYSEIPLMEEVIASKEEVTLAPKTVAKKVDSQKKKGDKRAEMDWND